MTLTKAIATPPDQETQKVNLSAEEISAVQGAQAAALPKMLHAHNEFVREQRIEQGQVTFDGITVKTDSRTIEWFNGLYTDAKLDSDFAFSGFNAVSGTTNLTAAQIIGLRNAGVVFIATQFALYNSVKSGINNGDIEYISQIESAYE